MSKKFIISNLNTLFVVYWAIIWILFFDIIWRKANSTVTFFFVCTSIRYAILLDRAHFVNFFSARSDYYTIPSPLCAFVRPISQLALLEPLAPSPGALVSTNVQNFNF